MVHTLSPIPSYLLSSHDALLLGKRRFLETLGSPRCTIRRLHICFYVMRALVSLLLIDGGSCFHWDVFLVMALGASLLVGEGAGSLLETGVIFIRVLLF
jgi:hypothetical protein